METVFYDMCILLQWREKFINSISDIVFKIWYIFHPFSSYHVCQLHIPNLYLTGTTFEAI